MERKMYMTKNILAKIKARKSTPVIIIADKNNEKDSKEVYQTFIELFNNITKGEHKFTIDFNKDYYVVDINNINETMTIIDDVTERIKDRNIILVSGGIRREILNYYEWAEPYFNFLARAAGKFVNISSYVDVVYDLLFNADQKPLPDEISGKSDEF